MILLALLLFELFEITLKFTINLTMALVKWPKMITFVTGPFKMPCFLQKSVNFVYHDPTCFFYDLNPLKLTPFTILPCSDLCWIWYLFILIIFLEELYHSTFGVFRPKTKQKSSFLTFARAENIALKFRAKAWINFWQETWYVIHDTLPRGFALKIGGRTLKNWH